MQPPPASQSGREDTSHADLGCYCLSLCFVIIGGNVWISSSLGAVPGIWATIMYILFAVIGTLIGILQLNSSLTHPKATVNKGAPVRPSPIVMPLFG
jgi:hypothetical protein